MWVSDGSPEISIEGNKVSCKVDPSAGSQVYNALWKESDGDTGIQSGTAYWKVTCDKLEDGLFVGVTDLEKFKQGWGCKALLYGGNLSDGGSLLVSNFGPWPKTGDVLGILVNVDATSIKVYFDINGRPLGLAFDVPRKTLSNVFPALHFSGNGTASIQKSDALPATTSREEEKFDGLEGHWSYTSGSFEMHETTPTMEIRGNPNNYKCSLHVINNISVSLKPSGTGKWTGQTGATTLMGGPPEIMQLENLLVQHVSGTIALNETGNLTIVKEAKSSVWSRFTPQKAAVTENPFQ